MRKRPQIVRRLFSGGTPAFIAVPSNPPPDSNSAKWTTVLDSNGKPYLDGVTNKPFLIRIA